MADSTVSIRGGPKALSRAMTRTLENVHRAMQRAAVDVARWGVTRMVQESTEKATATAQFKRQWKVVKFPGGAATANTSPYAAMVEAGRGAGRMPPVKAIEAWILAKKGIRPKKPPTVSRKEALRATSKAHRITGDVSGGKQRKRMRANIKLYAKIYRSKPARTYRYANLIAGMALGIARKIGKKGTKPKWLLRDVLDDFRREAAKNYDAAVRRVARDPLGRPRRAS